MSGAPAHPFRLFFPLAVLHAVADVGIWLPALAGWSGTDGLAAPDGSGHGHGLLFGAYPAVLCGFLLTALPRWTGRAPLPRALSMTLAALWLAGPASLFLYPVARGLPAALFLTALAGVVAWLTLTWGRRRDVKIALLVALLAGAAWLDLLATADELARRVALAAFLGLVMVLGGRIVPSLTAVQLERQGGAALPPRSRRTEFAAAGAAGLALAAWSWAPQAAPTAWLALAAAVAQGARCACWQPWRVLLRPSLVALHAGYACLPGGFALAFLAGLMPGEVPGSLVLHVWGVGAIGLMCLAVMASMIRRHLGPPLMESPGLTAALGLVAAALVARAAAELAGDLREPLLLAAAATWIAGQLVFLARFAPELLLGRPAIRRRDRRSADWAGRASPACRDW